MTAQADEGFTTNSVALQWQSTPAQEIPISPAASRTPADETGWRSAMRRPFLAGLLFSGIVVAALPLAQDNVVRTFILGRGVTQLLLIGLFLFGVISVVDRLRVLRREWAELHALLAKLPAAGTKLGRDGATVLIAGVTRPAGSWASALLAAIVSAYLEDEPPREAADRALYHAHQAARGYLNPVRGLAALLPLVGLLGNLGGLHLAMQAFSAIGAHGGADDLRNQLAQFAAGLSQSFDTTLTGLALMLMLLALTVPLASQQARLLRAVDDFADMLARRLFFATYPLPRELETLAETAISGLLERVEKGFDRLVEQNQPAIDAMLARTEERVAALRGQLREDVSEENRAAVNAVIAVTAEQTTAAARTVTTAATEQFAALRTQLGQDMREANAESAEGTVAGVAEQTDWKVDEHDAHVTELLEQSAAAFDAKIDEHDRHVEALVHKAVEDLRARIEASPRPAANGYEPLRREPRQPRPARPAAPKPMLND